MIGKKDPIMVRIRDDQTVDQALEEKKMEKKMEKDLKLIEKNRKRRKNPLFSRYCERK